MKNLFWEIYGTIMFGSELSTRLTFGRSAVRVILLLLFYSEMKGALRNRKQNWVAYTSQIVTIDFEFKVSMASSHLRYKVLIMTQSFFNL